MLPLEGSANKCLDVPSFTISWSLLSVLLLLTSPPANLLERRCPVGGEPPGGPDVPLECRGFSCGVALTLPAGLVRVVTIVQWFCHEKRITCWQWFVVWDENQ